MEVEKLIILKAAELVQVYNSNIRRRETVVDSSCSQRTPKTKSKSKRNERSKATSQEHEKT